jgi:sialic acid synthase SpsE/mannose-6-phosphate isomerase-like protein (cupin superfamily)
LRLDGVMEKFQIRNLDSSKPLLILDLANNHNGSIEHGKRIIAEIAKLRNPQKYPIAVKFQYRDLPNFIHPDFRARRDLKYVDRFLSTQLTWDEFEELKEFAAGLGLLTACTPFDEYSVEKIQEHKFDILKIASASVTDWGLLEAVSKWCGPIVASTAGVTQFEIDRVVAFLSNRNKDFALMHCVAAYPTSDSDLQLNRISRLRERYLNVPIGYSTHENPENLIAAPLAIAKGAVILERHVGLEGGGVSLNQYSTEVANLNAWIQSLVDANIMLGAKDSWLVVNKSEQEALSGLRRYSFAKKDILKGSKIEPDQVFFGIPGEQGQIQANDLGKYESFVATTTIKANDPILKSNVIHASSEEKVVAIRESILNLIKESGVSVPRNAVLEISHHYGFERFDEFGVCMITVINRDYCKKLLLLLPGQTHPPMFHKKKDETFFLVYGDCKLLLDNTEVTFNLGDTAVIPPTTIHEMSSRNGAIIEEVSSTHILDDSFYLDDSISRNSSRKTFVQYWI